MYKFPWKKKVEEVSEDKLSTCAFLQAVPAGSRPPGISRAQPGVLYCCRYQTLLPCLHRHLEEFERRTRHCFLDHSLT